MKKITLLLFLLAPLFLKAQNSIQKEINSRLVDLHNVGNNDENFEGFERIKNEIGDAQIVMLGEQSHSDATTYETKIKLIKYLHEEMGFEILIYECDKAWSMIQKGHNVKDALAKGIFGIWSTVEELDPLYEYVEKELAYIKPLMVAGFDPQFSGKIAPDYFADDLSSFLATFEKASPYKGEIQQLQAYINTGGKKIKKKEAIQNMAFLQKLIELIEKQQNIESADFWIQNLKSLEVWMSDTHLKTDNRDRQMADNLIWLKEKYPDKKIICWGATSHFLYNSSNIKLADKKIQKAYGDYYSTHTFMGDYLKEKYGDELYTIGFIAHEGTFGYNRNVTIEPPLKNSLEYLIGKSENDNYFLPLHNLSLEGYLSRPLAHQNLSNDIAQVMDGVVFNRHMRRPITNWELLLNLFPENTMSAKKKERFLREYRIQKEKEKNEKIKEEGNKEKARV